MFRRVAIADMDVPCAPPGRDGVTLSDAGIPKRQRCDAIGEIERAFRLALSRIAASMPQRRQNATVSALGVGCSSSCSIRPISQAVRVVISSAPWSD